MALDIQASGTSADVANNLKVALSQDPLYTGGVRNFSENDPGLALGGVARLVSPEVDEDFRIRTANDMMLDEENFSYTAQNFTKHFMLATTFVPTFTATGFNTNPSNLTTINATTCLKTYKTFSNFGTETLSFDIEGAFNANMVANQTIEFGIGLTANTTPHDCFDGVYIRANSAGVIGVLRNNLATDVATTPVFKDYTGATFVPIVNRKYQFIVYETVRSAYFWISDPTVDQIWLAGDLPVPAGYGMPTASSALPIFLRQVNGASAPASAVSFNLSRYSVRRGGTNIGTTLNVLAARANESINSPGTLTTTANQTVTAGRLVPTTAAVPANATSLLASLSGIVIETMTLAAGTDGILMSYAVPALPVAVGTTYASNKRLRIDGINIGSLVSTVFVGGPVAKSFYLAYGSTSLSLAGVATDTATTKAYRRVQLPIVQSYPATAAAGTIPSSSAASYVFQTPIFVNPGEFVALVTSNSVAATSGAVTHNISFDFSWE